MIKDEDWVLSTGTLRQWTHTAEMTPGAVHKIIPGEGHACCLEDPAAFDAFVLEFLEENGLFPTGA